MDHAGSIPAGGSKECGHSSVVERHVANVNVVGSTPIARSKMDHLL